MRVGMEATGYSRWFERLLAELGFELWIGDPAEIKARRPKDCERAVVVEAQRSKDNNKDSLGVSREARNRSQSFCSRRH